MSKIQVFTFGSDHIGEESGNLANSYMVIEGSFSSARERMMKLSNGHFCTSYDSEEEAGVQRFGLKRVELQPVKSRRQMEK